jgi:AcrR family transcriptional regulator
VAEPVPTKERILTAAQRLFRERGWSGTSVREIALAARADPALVIRHFTSKELLFLEAMDVEVDASPLVAVPLDRFGEAFVAFLLDADEGTRSVFLAFVRGSGEPAIAARLKDAHERLFVAPLRARLAGDGAEERARLAAALVAGLLYSTWVVGDEVLLAADRHAVIARYGALLQQLLTPDR